MVIARKPPRPLDSWHCGGEKIQKLGNVASCYEDLRFDAMKTVRINAKENEVGGQVWRESSLPYAYPKGKENDEQSESGSMKVEKLFCENFLECLKVVLK